MSFKLSQTKREKSYIHPFLQRKPLEYRSSHKPFQRILQKKEENFKCKINLEILKRFFFEYLSFKFCLIYNLKLSKDFSAMSQLKTLFIFALFVLMITSVTATPSFLRNRSAAVNDDCPPAQVCGKHCCELTEHCGQWGGVYFCLPNL